MDKLSIKLNIANRFYPMKIDRSSEEIIRNSVKKIDEVEKYYNLKVPVTEIARITARSRSTIYKVLKEELGYISNRLVKNDKNSNRKAIRWLYRRLFCR